MDEPIACSLEASDARAQLDEWHGVLAGAVVSVERVSAGSVRMGLRPALDDITTLLELAQREVACCPFFRFAVEIDAHGATLTVSVPSEAAPVLDAFTGLATA